MKTVWLTVALVFLPGWAVAQTCPNPPLGFAVTYHQTGTQVTFRWDNATDCTVSSYELQAGRTPGASDLGIARMPGSFTSLSLALPQGLQFYARLVAFTQTARSAPTSPDLLVAFGASCGVPLPPTDITVTPNPLGDRYMDIRWLAPVAGCSPQGYAVRVRTEVTRPPSTVPETVVVVAADVDRALLLYTTPLMADGAYTVTVASLTRTGRSAEAPVPPAPPANFLVPGIAFPFPPFAPSNLAARMEGRTVILTWDVPFIGGALFHRLTVGRSPGEVIETVDLGRVSSPLRLTPQANVSGLFYLRLRAYNVTGVVSEPSNEVTVFIPF